ncbi:MAG: 50S ribosomal protein L35 [Elusimicrobiales bacterium]|nr:50S ribosomal protein L35 [Elusimicrobiales bacterium]
MPKLKSHSGAKKRFHKTASGKWTHARAGRRHLLIEMSSKRGRHLRRSAVHKKSSAEAKMLKAYLPYD